MYPDSAISIKQLFFVYQFLLCKMRIRVLGSFCEVVEICTSKCRLTQHYSPLKLDARHDAGQTNCRINGRRI